MHCWRQARNPARAVPGHLFESDPSWRSGGSAPGFFRLFRGLSPGTFFSQVAGDQRLARIARRIFRVFFIPNKAEQSRTKPNNPNRIAVFTSLGFQRAAEAWSFSDTMM